MTLSSLTLQITGPEALAEGFNTFGYRPLHLPPQLKFGLRLGVEIFRCEKVGSKSLFEIATIECREYR